MEYLATFHNDETNMTALVFESKNKCGGFAVALRDDDSGMILPAGRHGIKSRELADAEARRLADVE